MKKLYSCLIILTVFASCTSDTIVANEPIISNKGTADILPAYSSNPYDGVGVTYNEIFDAYYDGSSLPITNTAIIARVTQLANANSSFAGINPIGYSALDPEHVQYLANQGNAAISNIMSNSSLSSTAKVSLGNFMTSIVSLYSTESDATLLYNAFVKYEDSVINDTVFTANDKRIILVTTSIARYTAYRLKKKPKRNTDPDWIIFVGHIAGTEEGAEENNAKAIVEGLITGIVSNK